MVEYGNIVPNMAKIYLLKSGEVRDPLGLDNFHPNSNVNGIIVHIEGGSPSNIATMAFNPNIKNFLATHNFPLFYRGQVEHTVGNEARPRTFSQYIGWVPNIVLALNVNKNTTMSVGVTVNQQSGIELLGAFRFITDLPNATQEMDDYVAYVWEESENGYYQVSFNVLTQSYEWVKQSVGVNNHYNITTKSGIFTKQFNVFNMTIQKGFANPNAITQLEDEQYRLIWQELAQLSAFIQQNTTLIGDLQEQIDELNLHVVKTITKQDTNTIAINLTRIPLLDNNNVEITAVVRVDSNNALNILEITQDGLLVDKTNVYDFIVEQFNDTNSDLHIAVLDLINDKLEEHNTNPTAHQDIRESIEKLDNNKLDKVWNNITSQTITNLNDEFVLNRGGAVYKTTLANMLSYVVPIDIFIVVSELPEFGVPNKIYLVPSEDPELQNALEEFIWVDNAWERIGGISIDLSNYVIANNPITAGTKTKITYDEKGLVTGGSDLVPSDIPNLAISKTIGLQGTLDSKLKKNADIVGATHTKITYDSKGLVTAGADLVESDIPTLSPSKITQDANNRFVTDTEKSTWNGKQDALTAGDNITIVGNTISASGGGGIDLDEIGYLNHAAKIFYDSRKQNQFKNAWEDMKEVDGAEIERTSTSSTRYGTLQYPNGENNGVIIPNSVTSIGDYAFSGWSVNNQPLVIPNSVTSIGQYAFQNWSANNQPLVIPDSITSIGFAAFRGWSVNNQPLVIPNSVTRIDTQAFQYWMANNQPLVIPNSVTRIDTQAFQYWTNVPYIIMERETPPTLSNANTFDNQNDAPIYVPDGNVDDYKTATNWSALASRIFSINEK